MSVVIEGLAKHLQERVVKAEAEVERLTARVAELEGALRVIATETECGRDWVGSVAKGIGVATPTGRAWLVAASCK